MQDRTSRVTNKVVDLEKLAGIVESLKKQGKTVVVCNGSYDLMHYGHIDALRQAKQKGDVLIVLVNSDFSVRKYKGPDRPYIPERYRVLMVSEIGLVDYISVFHDARPTRYLEKIRPDVYCSGFDWGGDTPECKAVKKYGGKVYILKRRFPIFSSTIVDRVTQKPTPISITSQTK